MDKAAELRAQSHGVGLTVRYEGRYPYGPKGERLPSYDVAVGCRVQGGDENRKAALADLVKFETPALIDDIELWLAELSVITAGRGADGISAELLVTAYSSRLSEYPADVVKYALLKRTWKWFPSWAELETICKAKSGPRRHMISALSQPAPDPSPRRRSATAEEKARIAELVAEQFPSISKPMQESAVDKIADVKQTDEEWSQANINTAQESAG